MTFVERPPQHHHTVAGQNFPGDGVLPPTHVINQNARGMGLCDKLNRERERENVRALVVPAMHKNVRCPTRSPDDDNFALSCHQMHLTEIFVGHLPGMVPRPRTLELFKLIFLWAIGLLQNFVFP